MEDVNRVGVGIHVYDQRDVLSFMSLQCVGIVHLVFLAVVVVRETLRITADIARHVLGPRALALTGRSSRLLRLPVISTIGLAASLGLRHHGQTECKAHYDGHQYFHTALLFSGLTVGELKIPTLEASWGRSPEQFLRSMKQHYNFAAKAISRSSSVFRECARNVAVVKNHVIANGSPV